MDYIIVGIGNPGRQYEETRHNIGWVALDAFAKKQGAKINRIRFHALCAETAVNGKKILLMKPQTYVNNSGLAVTQARDYYNVPPENVIVVCDDIALPVARVRIRVKGSAGGHNGLKSIIEGLHTDVFPRLRIGVSDRGDPTTDLADWVLGNFSGADRKKLKNRMDDICAALELMVQGKTDEAMSKYNGDGA